MGCTTFLAPAISGRAWLTASSPDPAYSKTKDQTANEEGGSSNLLQM